MHWCRPLRRLCTWCFCSTTITTISRVSGCSGASVGWCLFFPTHIFLQLPEEAICGDKALKARTPFGGCAARPGGLCAVALGCTWLRPPAGTAFSLFGFFFTVVTQKVRRALSQPVALSATLFIFAHAPLLPTNFHVCCPPAGLGVHLFTRSGAGLRCPLMCCLFFL